MKCYIYIILVVSFTIFVSTAQAHNPEIATFRLQHKTDQISILEIDLARAGLDAALFKFYPEVDLENISAKSYKELLVNYLKETILMTSHLGEKIRLGEGGIKLGGHQTSLKFIVENFPQKPKELNFTINSFSENKNQTNILRLLINGERRKYFLKKKNNFSTKVLLERKRPTLNQARIDYSYLTYFLGLLLLLFSRKNIKSLFFH